MGPRNGRPPPSFTLVLPTAVYRSDDTRLSLAGGLLLNADQPEPFVQLAIELRSSPKAPPSPIPDPDLGGVP